MKYLEPEMKNLQQKFQTSQKSLVTDQGSVHTVSKTALSNNEKISPQLQCVST